MDFAINKINEASYMVFYEIILLIVYGVSSRRWTGVGVRDTQIPTIIYIYIYIYIYILIGKMTFAVI